jgi:hypothetical protein
VRNVTVRIVLVCAALSVVGASAQAQRRMRGGRAVQVEPFAFGPRLGYDFHADHVFVGGQLNVPVAQRWALVPSAEFYPGEGGSPFRVNADLKYHPPTVYGLFYLGGGFTYLHASSVGHGGGNVFAGWEARRARPMRPFLEGKLVFVASTTSLNVEGGINIPL